VLGFTTLCCVFLFPETRFNRKGVPTHSPVTSPSVLKEKSSDRMDQLPGLSDSGTAAAEHVDPEKGTPVSPSADHSGADNGEKLTHVHTHRDIWLGRGKPSKSQWRIAQPYEGSIFLELVLPWKLLLFPIVEFSSFVVSWSASAFLTINLTQSQAFASPPYNFSSTKIGFLNFALLAGALIGLVTAGPLSDMVAAVLTKRNRGIREPEMRLLAMIPYVIIMIIGNIVVAIGYERAWNWKVCYG
jgi:hypothetical protein